MTETDALREEVRRLKAVDNDILLQVSDLILAIKEHEREIMKLNARLAHLEGKI